MYSLAKQAFDGANKWLVRGNLPSRERGIEISSGEHADVAGSEDDGPSQQLASCERREADPLVAGTVDEIERPAQHHHPRERKWKHEPLASARARPAGMRAIHRDAVDRVVRGHALRSLRDNGDGEFCSAR